MDMEKLNGEKDVVRLVDGLGRCDTSGAITRGTMMKIKRGAASHNGGNLWIGLGLFIREYV